MRKTPLAVLVLCSVWLWAVPARAVAQAHAPSVGQSAVVAVEVVGEVPGFTPQTLAAFLAGHMQEVVGPPWHFTAAAAGVAAAPNAVVWKFQVLRRVWPGSNFRDLPRAIHSAWYLSAEVKLYLDGTYQATILRLPTVNAGSPDADLTEMTAKVTQALFGEGGAAWR